MRLAHVHTTSNIFAWFKTCSEWNVVLMFAESVDSDAGQLWEHGWLLCGVCLQHVRPDHDDDIVCVSQRSRSSCRESLLLSQQLPLLRSHVQRPVLHRSVVGHELYVVQQHRRRFRRRLRLLLLLQQLQIPLCWQTVPHWQVERIEHTERIGQKDFQCLNCRELLKYAIRSVLGLGCIDELTRRQSAKLLDGLVTHHFP